MSNKSKQDESLKKFSENKVFVMTRPNEGGDHLSITTEEFSDQEGELAELYHAVFFDYLLNLSGELTVKQHKLVLAQMIAPLAYQFFLINSEKAHSIVHHSLEQLKNEKVNVDFIKKMPDEVSMLDYILRHNLYLFLEEVKELDLDIAIKDNEDFLNDLETIFFSLPAAFCFGMIEAISLIIPQQPTKRKTPPKKKPKK